MSLCIFHHIITMGSNMCRVLVSFVQLRLVVV